MNKKLLYLALGLLMAGNCLVASDNDSDAENDSDNDGSYSSCDRHPGRRGTSDRHILGDYLDGVDARLRAQAHQKQLQNQQNKAQEDKARSEKDRLAQERYNEFMRHRQELEREIGEQSKKALAQYNRYDVRSGTCTSRLSDDQAGYVIRRSQVTTIDDYIERQQGTISECARLRADQSDHQLGAADQYATESAELKLSAGRSAVDLYPRQGSEGEIEGQLEKIRKDLDEERNQRCNAFHRGICVLDHNTNVRYNMHLCNLYKTGSALAGLACAALAWKFKRSRPKTAMACAGLGVGFGCLFGLFTHLKNKWHEELQS